MFQELARYCVHEPSIPKQMCDPQRLSQVDETRGLQLAIDTAGMVHFRSTMWLPLNSHLRVFHNAQIQLERPKLHGELQHCHMFLEVMVYSDAGPQISKIFRVVFPDTPSDLEHFILHEQ